MILFLIKIVITIDTGININNSANVLSVLTVKRKYFGHLISVLKVFLSWPLFIAVAMTALRLLIGLNHYLL